MPQTHIRVDDVQEYLCDQIRDTDWWSSWRFFLQGSEFREILLRLKREVEEDRRFCPPAREFMLPFTLTPLSSVKVVFLVPEPPPFINYASGLALHHKKVGKNIDTFLKRLYLEIKQFHPNVEQSSDLRKWAEQGVLLVHASWTCQIGRRGVHHDLWRPATTVLIDSLRHRKDVLWVLFGSTRERYGRLIKGKQLGVEFPHESRAQKWEAGKLFGWINDNVVGEKIKW